jgi:hypothetical protein
MSQRIRALDRITFGWDAPQDVDWVRGTISGLPAYAVLDLASASGATSIPAAQVPAPGTGFYWLVRPVGGSWSSGGAGECRVGCPSGGRDGNLPLP